MGDTQQSRVLKHVTPSTCILLDSICTVGALEATGRQVSGTHRNQQYCNVIRRLKKTPSLVKLHSFRSVDHFGLTARAISAATRSLLGGVAWA